MVLLLSLITLYSRLSSMRPFRLMEMSVSFFLKAQHLQKGDSVMIIIIITWRSVQAVIDHSYNRDLLPLPIVVRSNIEMHQKAGK